MKTHTLQGLSARELDELHQAHNLGVTYMLPSRGARGHGRGWWQADCSCGAIDPQQHGTRAAAERSFQGHFSRVTTGLMELRASNGGHPMSGDRFSLPATYYDDERDHAEEAANAAAMRAEYADEHDEAEEAAKRYAEADAEYGDHWWVKS